jgi:pimeloyl-ACP methyl ester carboxylesterase
MRVCQRSPGQTAALAEAIDRYRAVRGIERVDLLGESWGGAIASQLAAEPERVRSCVIVSAAYRTPTPTLDAAARAPGQRAMLDGIPDGYLPIGLEIWGPLLAPCPPTVREWAIADQVGYARARRSTPSSICPTSIPPSRGSPGS